MTELITKLCEVPAVSGDESRLADVITQLISPYCESVYTDPLGNVIAFKKGKSRAVKRVLLDAHMDEVGLIITAVNSDGSLKFATVGGINAEVLPARRVWVGDRLGVIQQKPIHLLIKDERAKMPKKDSLTIDIGAVDRAEAEQYVSVGDFAHFDSDTVLFGDGRLKARALDDRAGCAVLVELLRGEVPFDIYCSFSVQEEVGLRGARAAAYTVEPDYAVAIESTTAVDIADVPPHKQVCTLGGGAALSFMDATTVYDRELFELACSTAECNGIRYQLKQAATGGNNAGAIHLSRAGVPTVAVSVPCRYLHSAGCVIDLADVQSVGDLVKALLAKLSGGQL